jgi:ribosomal protein S21
LRKRRLFKERKRAFYEKPSVRRKRERAEAQRHRRKEERRRLPPFVDSIFRPIP